MVSIDDYRQNPCGFLSIPYWKAAQITMPDYIKIVHDNEFSEELLETYTDKKYFRLHHDLKITPSISLDDFELVTADRSDTADIVQIINQSYADIRVDIPQMNSYKATPVYCSDLWIVAREKCTRKSVGCIIADFDKNIGEVILEWVQVLPEYRSRKIGQAMVNEVLRRSAVMAEFATVSGEINNPANPEALYRKCGFTGSDVWHILQKKVAD